MAALGSIGTQYKRAASVILVTYTQPALGLYPVKSLGVAGGNLQAIYRWTGTEWQQIKASYWDGSAWVLV